ncbi:Squalene/phytoene synthase-domain-containing protein [Chytriomyces sp. MP71]|nr:Squalene/phytoene synthase-domain-containing protein [Chytriomyces sp. MP71]
MNAADTTAVLSPSILRILAALVPHAVIFVLVRPFVSRGDAAKAMVVSAAVFVHAFLFRVLVNAWQPIQHTDTPQLSYTDAVPLFAHPVLASLSTLLFMPWYLHSSHLTKFPRALRVVPTLALLVLASLGLASTFNDFDSWGVGTLLGWACPVLACQWWIAGPFIWSLKRPVGNALLLSTLCLAFSSFDIIGFNKKFLLKSGSNGATAYIRSAQRILLIFLVNLMTIFGLLIVDRTLSILRVLESRIGGRGGRSVPNKVARPSFLAPWTLQYELLLWLKCMFLQESHIDQVAVTDFKLVSDLIAVHSKTFALASKLYLQPLREDITALYGFCRVTDDVADVLESAGPNAKLWKHECMVLIEEYVHACYLQRGASLGKMRLEALIRCISNRVVEYPNSADCVTAGAVFRLFADRVPRCVPKSCILELLEGYKFDMVHKRVKTEQDLLTYCGYVASSVGEACTYLMLFHEMESSLPRFLDAINLSGDVVHPEEDVIQCAREMGVALQLTNIARDLIADAEDLGRVYVPDAWFLEGLPAPSKLPSESEGPVMEGFPLIWHDELTPAASFSQEGCTGNSWENLRDTFVTLPSSNPVLLRDFSRQLVNLANPFAASAIIGIKQLPVTNQAAVRSALTMYLEIGVIIAQSKSYPRRASVSTLRKLEVLLRELYF